MQKRLESYPSWLIGGGAALAIGILLVLIGGSAVTIDAGHVGVVKTWGAADQVTWDPGFHLKMPVAQSVVPVDVRTQNHAFREAAAASRELQNVYVDGGVNFKIDSSKVVELYTTVGLDYAAKVFDPAFQDYLKEVVPTYSTTDILAHREEIRSKVKSKLSSTAAGYGIDVLDVFITNIHFDADYTKAIEAKQVAQQDLEKAKITAQTQITTAQGQAQAQIEQAKGDAESNRLRQQSLSPDLIQYLEVQKWDGKLPQVTGGGSPLVSVTGR